jgi:dihydroorotate dehydrogenase (NAD+) catalytic subunit
MPDLPRYDPAQSYDWNYGHAPEPVAVEIPAVAGRWDFCGLKTASPLGVAAGPLLNGKWLLYYASLGFDVLVYKTVRSVERAAYPMPNLLPVRCGQLDGTQRELPASQTMEGSWAVSFGMPSRAPDVWRADVARTRRRLAPGKVLVVSVVGSVEPDWSIDDLAADYAKTAEWAIESGADAVETNFSCPNVSTCDGQLYQQPESASRVAAAVRARIGDVRLIVKVGHLSDAQSAAALVEALSPWAQALAMTNSVAAAVSDAEGRPLFDGERRGICGRGILRASIAQTAMVAGLIAERGLELRLVGVGGAATAEDVEAYLDAGAHAVHLATAAMVDPGVALAIRRGMLHR